MKKSFTIKTFILTAVALALILSAQPAASASAQPAAYASTQPAALASAPDEITVLLNGNKLIFDVPPQIIDGRTLVPLRVIFEALGAKVDWDDGTQTISATRGSTTIFMGIGVKMMTVGNRDVALDVPPQLIDDRTLVPARAVAEAFGADVDWIDATNTVIITDSGAAGNGNNNSGGKDSGAVWKAIYLARMLDIQRSVAENIYGDPDAGGGYELYPLYISDFRLADLNFSGEPELLVYGETFMASNYVLIYTIDGNSDLAIFNGIISLGPYLYRDPGNNELFYSFTVMDYSYGGGSELYEYTVNETSARSGYPRTPEGGAVERVKYTMELDSNGGAKYTFNGMPVSETEYDIAVDGIYNGYAQVGGYPLSVSEMYDAGADGYSADQLSLFLNAYAPE